MTFYVYNMKYFSGTVSTKMELLSLVDSKKLEGKSPQKAYNLIKNFLIEKYGKKKGQSIRWMVMGNWEIHPTLKQSCAIFLLSRVDIYMIKWKVRGDPIKYFNNLRLIVNAHCRQPDSVTYFDSNLDIESKKCNYPTCSISNRNQLHRCMGCKISWYCGRNHQKMDWASHKLDCIKSQ